MGGIALNVTVLTCFEKRDSLLALSEKMQRSGRWAAAEDALNRCLCMGLITAADYNLTLSGLSWRRECAEAAYRLIAASGGQLTRESLSEMLVGDFDEYAVGWLLSEFEGLPVLPDE